MFQLTVEQANHQGRNGVGPQQEIKLELFDNVPYRMRLSEDCSEIQLMDDTTGEIMLIMSTSGIVNYTAKEYVNVT